MAKNISPQTIQQLIEQITVPEPGDPRNASDIENPAQALLNNTKYLLEQLAAHIEAMGAHGATSAATADKIVRRDSAGRAKFAVPAASADAATKGYVDARMRVHDFNLSFPTSTLEAGANGHIDINVPAPPILAGARILLVPRELDTSGGNTPPFMVLHLSVFRPTSSSVRVYFYNGSGYTWNIVNPYPSSLIILQP
jgi:hypothetical protein